MGRAQRKVEQDCILFLVLGSSFGVRFAASPQPARVRLRNKRNARKGFHSCPFVFIRLVIRVPRTRPTADPEGAIAFAPTFQARQAHRERKDHRESPEVRGERGHSLRGFAACPPFLVLRSLFFVRSSGFSPLRLSSIGYRLCAKRSARSAFCSPTFRRPG